MKWAERFACECEFRRAGLVEGAFGINMNECIDCGVYLLNLGEVGLDEFDRRDFFLADFFSEPGS